MKNVYEKKSLAIHFVHGGKVAWKTLAAARLLLNDGFSDFSANRSYHAMFYAMEALALGD